MLGLASPFWKCYVPDVAAIGESNIMPTALWYNAAGMVVSFVLVLILGEDMSSAMSVWPFMVAIGVLAVFSSFMAYTCLCPASVLAPSIS